MKSSPRPALIALGVAALSSLSLTGPLISSTHESIYHLSGPALALFAPVLLDFCLLWLVLAALLSLAEHIPALHTPLWCVLLAAIPYILLKEWAALGPHFLPPNTVLVVFLLPALILLTLAIFWPARVLPVFAPVQNFASTVLAFGSLLGILVFVQLVWFAWQARNLNPTPVLHRRSLASTTQPPRPRVIWILLDELSFQQVYEQRYPGLLLPAFDRLAAGSTVFTHAIPAGNRTSLVLPSLITGLPVDTLRVAADGQLLSLHNPITGAWQPFDPHRTVFQDALDRGYSTAIAGWYNPYCRILPQVLDNCFWTLNIAFDGHMFPSPSIASPRDVPPGAQPVSLRHLIADNALNPLRGMAYSFLLAHRLFPHGTSRFDGDAGIHHLADYCNLLSAGDDLLADPASNFVFLHLPIPHPGGIYNRRSHAFTTGTSSYIDNLALADLYLAHVRQLLERQNQWDSSTIVVMGDHSWRSNTIWATFPEWTPEDAAASHNASFDPRPAYILKLPHQQTPARIDTPFAATRTRALLDALLDDRLHTPADLQAWAAQQP